MPVARKAVASLLALLLLALPTTNESKSMSDINTFPGFTPQEAIGKHIRDLEARIFALEREDRLTRVHPITGDTDFVGTVFRTPDGAPTLVISDNGLEAPPTTAAHVEDNYEGNSTGLAFALNALIGSSGPGVEIHQSQFLGVPSNALFIPIEVYAISGVDTGNGPGDEDFKIEMTVITAYTPDNDPLNVTSTTSPTYTFESGTFGEDPGVLFANGTWRWEHGLAPTQLGRLTVSVFLKAVEVPGQPLSLTHATGPAPKIVYVGGSGMNPNYSETEPFRLDSDL